MNILIPADIADMEDGKITLIDEAKTWVLVDFDLGKIQSYKFYDTKEDVEKYIEVIIVKSHEEYVWPYMEEGIAVLVAPMQMYLEDVMEAFLFKYRKLIMIKKILLLTCFLLTISFAQDKTNNYLDENKLDYSSLRPFVGLDGGYSYVDTTSDNGNLDNTLYGYSVYVGLPISSYEIIIKHKNRSKSDFELISNSLILNMAISGSGTDMTYFGIIGGEGELTWGDTQVSTLNLSSSNIKDTFYGMHIGQKYKFTRNFYVKIELEYMKYDFVSKTSTSDVSLDNTLEFIYGIEYRF